MTFSSLRVSQVPANHPYLSADPPILPIIGLQIYKSSFKTLIARITRAATQQPSAVAASAFRCLRLFQKQTTGTTGCSMGFQGLGFRVYNDNHDI